MLHSQLESHVSSVFGCECIAQSLKWKCKVIKGALSMRFKYTKIENDYHYTRHIYFKSTMRYAVVAGEGPINRRDWTLYRCSFMSTELQQANIVNLLSV